MNRLRLRRLQGQAFRSLTDFDVRFPDSGLMLLDGLNVDTGGSSAVGKTNFILALSKAFRHCPLAAGDLQSWLTDDEPWVATEVEDDSGVSAWRWGKVPTATMADGTKVRGAEAVGAAVEKLVGLSADALANISYREQRERGRFLSMGDVEKKEFLSGLLGLDAYERAAEEASKKAAALEKELAAANERLRVRQESASQVAAMVREPQLQDEAAAEDAVRQAERTLHDEVAALKRTEEALETARQVRDAAYAQVEEGIKKASTELDVRLFQARQELKAPPKVDDGEEKRLRAALEAVKARREALEKKDEGRRREHEAALRSVEARFNAYSTAASRLGELQLQRMKLEGERSKLAAAVCPTCDRRWDGAQTRAEQVEQQIADNERALQLARAAEHALPAVQVELEEARKFAQDPMLVKLNELAVQLLQQLAAEKVRVQGEEERFKAGVRERAAQIEAEKEKLRRRALQQTQAASDAQGLKDAELGVSAGKTAVASAQSRLDAARVHLNTVRVSNAAERRRCDEVKAQAQAVLQAVYQANEEASKIQAQLDEERDFAEMVGREGFLGLIFDEVLAEIADDVNRTLGEVPNVAGCTFRFRSEQVAKGSGNVRKAIVPVIEKAGQERSLKSALSGGMAEVVELAVDLSFRNVVMRRTGAFPAWMVLDEVLGGLGEVEKEACLQVLQRHAQDQLIIVTDHVPQFKQMFDKVLRATMRGDETTIEWVQGGPT